MAAVDWNTPTARQNVAWTAVAIDTNERSLGFVSAIDSPASLRTPAPRRSALCTARSWIVMGSVAVLAAVGLAVGLVIRNRQSLYPSGIVPRPSSSTTMTISLGMSHVQLQAGGRVYNMSVMAYNNTFLGPPITLLAGDTPIQLRLSLVNDLPAEQATPANPGPCYNLSTAGGVLPAANMNNPHGARTTNLHQHGLAVTAAVDAVDLHIPPGASHTYEHSIAPTTPSAFSWYHPHKHGSAITQVAHGLAGVVLVRGQGGLDASLAGAEEVVVAVSELNLYKDAPSASNGNGTSYSNDPVSFACAAQGGFRGPPYDLKVLLVNGQPVAYADRALNATNLQPWLFDPASLPVPTVQVRPGALLWLRILNARPFDFMALGIDSGLTAAGGADAAQAGLEAYLLAIDGYSLAAPQPLRAGLPFAPGYNNATGYILGPGGRVDIAIRIPLAAAEGTQYALATRLYTDCQPDPIGVCWSDGFTYPAATLYRINVTGPPLAAAVEVPTALAVPPSQELPLLPADVTARRVFTLAENIDGGGTTLDPRPAPPDPSMITGNPGPTGAGWVEGYYLNQGNGSGQAYSANASVAWGATEEWQVDNISPDPHPFHLHLVPAYVVGLWRIAQPVVAGTAYVSTLPVDGPSIISQGFWADVVSIPSGYRAVLRIPFRDLTEAGSAVYHCHSDHHATFGMMGTFDYGSGRRRQ